MSNRDVYELDQEFADLAESFDNAEEPVTLQEALANAVAVSGPANVADLERRFDQLLRWERNLAAAELAIAEEHKRLTLRKRTVEQRRAGLRDYLATLMHMTGRSKVKTVVATASLSPGRESLDVDPNMAYDWPADVFKAACIEQPPKVDKTVLKRDFADRLTELPGVTVTTGDEILTIR